MQREALKGTRTLLEDLLQLKAVCNYIRCPD